MKRLLSLLAMGAAAAAMAGGDLGESVRSGALFSEVPNTLPFFRGERFAWVVKDRQLRFPAPTFTLGTLPLGETLVVMEQGTIHAVRISLYNRGDMGPLPSGLAPRIDAASKALTALFETQGVAFSRKTDPTKNDHDVEGLRWSGNRTIATLEWGVARKGTAYVPLAEYLRLDLRDATATTAPAPASVRKDPRASVRRSPDGTVELVGIPMVDQGAKGYCAAATVARVMGYYGLDFLDQHQIASWAKTDAAHGTSPEVMMDELSRPLHDRYKLVCKELSVGKLDFGKLVEDYNRAAKSLKKPQVSLRAFAVDGVIHVNEVWETFDPEALRKARCNNAARNRLWIDTIRRNIDAGVPVVWSVMLGLVPETPALPQGGGGHMRLIIGYTPDSVLYTDSWGAGHERKTMRVEDAIFITTGLRTISRTLN